MKERYPTTKGTIILWIYATFIKNNIPFLINTNGRILCDEVLMGCADSEHFRILLAEDNPINQKITQKMLKHLGYHSDVAANGLEALHALESQFYNIILMDIHMPEMDGLQATRIIRQRWATGPKIIAITAYALDYSREMCLEAGMDDYIAKPVKMGELADVLRRHQSKIVPEQISR